MIYLLHTRFSWEQLDSWCKRWNMILDIEWRNGQAIVRATHETASH